MTFTKHRIVVIVKTYPNLSRRYDETVCVGGIDGERHWIRIFPVRFRQLPFLSRFKKFDVIEAEVEPANDKYMRKESYHVRDSTIRIIGHLPTKEDNWKQRKDLLLSYLDKSIESLEVEKEKSHRSLGIIKPREIQDFYKKHTSEVREWEKELMAGTQKLLDGSMHKYESPLAKIPYAFRYKFVCDDPQCAGHELMCEDWEMLELFRSMKEKYKDDEVAFQKLKDRYFTWLLKERDPYFIVGTESKWNNFIIVSVFYPPKAV